MHNYLGLFISEITVGPQSNPYTEREATYKDNIHGRFLKEALFFSQTTHTIRMGVVPLSQESYLNLKELWAHPLGYHL